MTRRRILVIEEATRVEATETAVGVLQMLYETEHNLANGRPHQALEAVREARRDLETLLGEDHE